MKDHVHERIGFREIDEHGNTVPAVSPHVPEQPDAERTRRSINPFIIALWVLDAALMIFGFWALSEAAAAMAGPTQFNTSAQLSFMLMSYTPYVLLGGLLLTAALLFWHAVQWQKKRP
ncbi:conserved hypothetical protein [Arthrobacter sp. 9V]|uniref:hypothetical protein n=1 Tax=Arthrobacter sp. 9V TaxID=2653132 RepID=UPI0012EF2405|nr:hypothetical protein [Arthrobacter sp. 9V]VXC36504.1 conserved hypothetical protein [Arthrobacter sp. 9V]